MTSTHRQDRDPIAVVGMACRLPGASGIADFWQVLDSGLDTTSEVPATRFDIDALHDPVPRTAGRIVTRRGGFLDGIEDFDADFFGMAERDAMRLDPGHRLLLEVAWEAVEDAGLTTTQLAGSRTGVYTSVLSTEYWDMLVGAGMIDLRAATGAGSWGLAAGWISHAFDLRGPAVGVDATCAASLIAVQEACRSLWFDESDKAIVGGVNLLLSPNLYLGLSQAGVLSPDGRCRFGDADANGYVRSEGAAVVVLKRMSDALADGDRIHALVRGTSVTSNGSSGGPMVAPSVEGQRAMLLAAHRDAGVDAAEIDYVEAHGPGTPAGDAAELTALAEVLGQRRGGDPCLVGSAKTNIGHTEVAAGLVGLIKTALALKHRRIPPTLHVTRPNPVLADFTDVLGLATAATPWADRGRPRMAGVSSFGLSGVNAHVVLEEAPAVPTAQRRDRAVPGFLLPISARCPDALRELSLAYADVVERVVDPVELYDVCFSASSRRSHHGVRAVVAGSSAAELAANLRSVTAGEALGGCHPLLSPTRDAFLRGEDAGWEALYAGGQFHELPSYPWQRRRHWLDSVPAA
ncbi:beta-ketoacyl synthase N-terminal-like domain-containing protein [Kutzneria sp. NPDC051319]|uniref:beta-ketoacyl synthase N-terminal-like domain-containing protein n=1 Tax=Kutzneria sp. NPDC051319 TaxID=3155047 RepID=UPI00343F1CC9